MRKPKYPCLNPSIAWRCGYHTAKDGILSNRYIFSFDEARDYYMRLYGSSGEFHLRNAEIAIDCGKCANCLARKRRDMSVRLQHERSLTEKACFITLTYNDDSLPGTDILEWKDGNRTIVDRGEFWSVPTLLPADVQKFIKRLRRHLEYVPTKKEDGIRDHVDHSIRYFAVGEYGARTGRPHYHIIIFGWSPSDQIVHERKKGYTINRSSQIEKLWTYGFSTVCDVTASTCNYCAQYVTKKFRNLSQDDVEGLARCPEFVLQSVRNGGIGAPWLDKFFANLRQGYVTLRSSEGIIKQPIPRYYYSRLRKKNRQMWLELRDERIAFLAQNSTYVLSNSFEVQEYLEEISARVDSLEYEWFKEDLRSII